jgi:pyrimidine deaminase RibD-like protein
MEGRLFRLDVVIALVLCNHFLVDVCSCLDAMTSYKIKEVWYSLTKTAVSVDITITTKLVRAAEHETSTYINVKK